MSRTWYLKAKDMGAFFRTHKRSFLCGECGSLTRDREHHADRSAFHAKAVADKMYRHRDDTSHSLMGPVGCHVCATLRQLAREAASKTKDQDLLRMILTAEPMDVTDVTISDVDEAAATKP